MTWNTVLIIFLFLVAGAGSAIAEELTSSSGSAPSTPAAGAPAGTADPSTWPGDENDPIWKCCHAIAYAEGFNVAGSVPNRLNNPGDISDGASQFGFTPADGSNVTNFPDASTGWSWLFDKISNAVNGNSSVYFPNMTWTQVAQKWAGNWQAWVTNVTRYMGVSPSDRFGDSFGV